MSELAFVAVPGGAVADDGATLRVLVVPRLSGLAETADLTAYGLSDWPGRLAQARLVAEWAPAVDGAVTELQTEVVNPEAGLGPRWDEVFPPTMPVRPFGRPPSYRGLTGEKSAAQAGVIQGFYTDAAKDPDNPAHVSAVMESEVIRAPALPRPSALEREDAELRAAAAAATPPPPAPDFHRVVTMLREHPRVLQALGLVVELRVPDAESIPAEGVIRVRCELDQGPHPVTCASTWTRFRHTTGNRARFLAAPDPGSDLVDGMLDVASSDWGLATFDVTGAVERLRDPTSVAATGAATTPVAAQEATALPTLRSAGLSLMRHDRTDQLQARAAAGEVGSKLTTLDGVELTADRLVLGYRVDVRSDLAGWRSAMQRRASYAAADADPRSAPSRVEEGQVKAHAATVEGPRRPDEKDARGLLPALRADEVVVRWDGWSLTCPKPGTPAARGAPGRPRLPHLSWSFQPVGLPTLRFGRTYNLRVRIADAAGGGLGLLDPDDADDPLSEDVFYGRHDPVPPPYLRPPEALVDPGPPPDEASGIKPQPPLGPGGALDVLVIRSNPRLGAGVDAYEAPYLPNDQRTFLPPSASWLLVDQHGKFGDHEQPVEHDEPDEATYAAWLRRTLEPETHRGDSTYSWLPDPMAQGMAVTILDPSGDRAKDETDNRSWALPVGAWPDFRAKSLVLQAPSGSGPKRVRWKGDVQAQVRLAAGEQAVVQVSSSVSSTDTGLLAMDNWLANPPKNRNGTPTRAAAGEQTMSEFQKRIREGRHPMVSPPRVLRLVHAVESPVADPTGTLSATRPTGSTYVDLVPSPPVRPRKGIAELEIHVPSTGQLELRASWQEAVDGRVPVDVPQLMVQMASVDPGATHLPLLRHELGDTRHRRITYRLRGVTRYREYFLADNDDTFATRDLEVQVSVPSSARPPEPVVLSVTPAFRWSGTDLPDGWTQVTRTRAGGVVRLELRRPWNASGEGEQLAVLLSGDDTLTTLRRDPIWSTPLPPAVATGDLFAGAGPVTQLTLPEHPTPVTVVPYSPGGFVDAGEMPAHCFVDVELPTVADTSYAAFVSLAVARYQAESVDDAHLSRVVRAEPVQLLPTRTLSVTRDADEVRVTLSGLQPVAAPAPVEPGDPVTPRQTRVDAHLEALPAGVGPTEVTAADPATGIGWQRVGLVSGGIGDELVLALPADGSQLRLVVREVEQLLPLNPPDDTAGELSDRVPFLDVVPLR